MFPKSIRWRVQLWLTALLALVLSGFGFSVYQLYRTTRFGQLDEELDRRVTAFASDIRKPPPMPDMLRRPPRSFQAPRHEAPGGAGKPIADSPDPNAERFGRERGFPRSLGPGADRSPPPFREIELSPGTMSLFDGNQTNGFYYILWSRENTVIKAASNAPPTVPFPGRAPAAAGIVRRMRGDYREASVTTEWGEVVMVGRSVAGDLVALRRFAGYVVLAGLAVMVVGVGGGWLLADRAIRPVAAISAAADRIAGGNLAERIDLSETDSELGRLGGVLNNTFARLEGAFAQQKQFTGDASHELRTPLAVMISEAQGTLARERTAAEYREALENCLATAQQMRRLTQSLLELARLDEGREHLANETLDLAVLARVSAEQIRPLVESRGIAIVCDLPPSLVTGDGTRLSQVLDNLLSNAITHNRDHREIRLSCRKESGAVVVSVSDTGAGIAANDLPHVFRRFYLGGKARTGSGAEGHAGLGLSIAKAVVEAHGGEITVVSKPGSETTFTVRLPLLSAGV